MNNNRRKEIARCILSLTSGNRLEDTLMALYDIVAAEDEYRDAIPENLQSGIRYEESEEASDYLNEAISSLECAAETDNPEEKNSCICDAIEALNSIN